MRSKQAGFSLVEVVISLAVLSVAFMGMIAVIVHSSKTNAITRERMYATRAAEKKIEQMLNCLSFNDLDSFRRQVEGLGWDQVQDMDNHGVLRPILQPIAAADLPPNTLKNGFDFNNPPPDPRAVLFVRFPLDATGNNYTEVDSGEFADCYKLAVPTNPASARTYQYVDMDASGTLTGTPLGISSCNVMPVMIEVLWRGVGGPRNVLRYRYTFYRRV